LFNTQKVTLMYRLCCLNESLEVCNTTSHFVTT
jgi:hypothetical protein